MNHTYSTKTYIFIRAMKLFEILICFICVLTSCDSIFHLQRCNKYADLVSSHLIKWNSIQSSSHCKSVIFNIFYIFLFSETLVSFKYHESCFFSSVKSRPTCPVQIITVRFSNAVTTGLWWVMVSWNPSCIHFRSPHARGARQHESHFNLALRISVVF